MTTAFPLVEKAVRELIESSYEPARGHTGGDPGFDPGVELFVWISLVPGGTADQLEGEFYVDVDVFSNTYSKAMSSALDLEALLVGPRHRTTTMRIDNIYANESPAERPWDDEQTYRIGATYVITARRPTGSG